MNTESKNNYLKTFLLSSLGFGLPTAGLSLLLGFSEAAVAWFIAGFVFGLIMTSIVYFMTKRSDAVKQKILGDTQVVLSGNANHLVSGEAVGGWLFLTENEVRFKSHKANIQNHELSLPVGDITSVETFKSLGLIPNGLRLGTSDGNESFVVNQQSRWVKEITARITS